jgi:hypothetical protein
MIDFVKQCRREWRRLRVPDAVANEMAADLEADLEEAKAEGVSAEAVLGSSIFDPRSFAAAWAAGRGVIPPARERPSRRPLALAALATVSVLGLIAAAVTLLVSDSGLAIAVGPVRFRPAPASPPGAFITPSGAVHPGGFNAHPVGWILLLLAVLGIILAAWLWSSWARSRPRSAIA